MCCWRLISRWNGLSPSKRTGRLAQEWSVRRRDPYRQRGIKLKGMRLQRSEHRDRMGGIEERRTLDGRESEIIAFKRLSSKESTRSLNKGLSCIHIIIYNYICICIYPSASYDAVWFYSNDNGSIYWSLCAHTLGQTRSLIHHQCLSHQPNVFCDGIILVFPRHWGVDRFAVDTEPLAELSESFLKDRDDSSVVSGPNIH